MTTGSNMISVENVDKYFGDFQALSDVSLQVKHGERWVICGPSGSGKSTFIRCLNALEFHDKGLIVVDGVTVEKVSKHLSKFRQEAGMVFQQFNLFPHLTILENLTIGPIRVRKISKAAAVARAHKYFARVHIPEQADKYPVSERCKLFLSQILEH